MLAEHYTHNISCGRETLEDEITAYVIECLDCAVDLMIEEVMP
jgi:hypothetical protein